LGQIRLWQQAREDWSEFEREAHELAKRQKDTEKDADSDD
jgi:hypothetical protein